MPQTKTVLLLTALLVIPVVSAEINFRSDQPIDFFNNIDMNNNEIRQFFNNACGDDEAVKNIRDDGTLVCGPAGGGLDTVLSENNTASTFIDMNERQVRNLAAPSGSNDAVRLQDVAGEYLNKSGDTVEGTLEFDSNNIALQNAFISNDGSNEGIQVDNDGNVSIVNGTLNATGNPVSNIGAPQDNLDAIRQQELSNYAKRSGPTFTGDIHLNGNEIQDTNGPTTLGEGNAEIPDGNLDMNNNNVTDTNCIGDQC